MLEIIIILIRIITIIIIIIIIMAVIIILISVIINNIVTIAPGIDNTITRLTMNITIAAFLRTRWTSCANLGVSLLYQSRPSTFLKILYNVIVIVLPPILHPYDTFHQNTSKLIDCFYPEQPSAVEN